MSEKWEKMREREREREKENIQQLFLVERMRDMCLNKNIIWIVRWIGRDMILKWIKIRQREGKNEIEWERHRERKEKRFAPANFDDETHFLFIPRNNKNYGWTTQSYTIIFIPHFSLPIFPHFFPSLSCFPSPPLSTFFSLSFYIFYLSLSLSIQISFCLFFSPISKTCHNNSCYVIERTIKICGNVYLECNQNQGKKNVKENWEREERTAHQTISHRIEQLSSTT